MDWATLINPLCGLDIWTLSLEQTQSAAATRANLTCIWLILLVVVVVLAGWYWTCQSEYCPIPKKYIPIINEQHAITFIVGVAITWMLIVWYQVWKSGRVWKVYQQQMDSLSSFGLEAKDRLWYMQQNYLSRLQSTSRIASAQLLATSNNNRSLASLLMGSNSGGGGARGPTESVIGGGIINAATAAGNALLVM
jgi:hypothetical protein